MPAVIASIVSGYCSHVILVPAGHLQCSLRSDIYFALLALFLCAPSSSLFPFVWSTLLTNL